MLRSTLLIALTGYIVASCTQPLRADEAIDAKIRTLVPEIESYIVQRHEVVRRSGALPSDRLGRPPRVREGVWLARARAPSPSTRRPCSRSAQQRRAFSPRPWRSPRTEETRMGGPCPPTSTPEFAMKDNWTTREFRSSISSPSGPGMPPYANDIVGVLGADPGRRWCAPCASSSRCRAFAPRSPTPTSRTSLPRGSSRNNSASPTGKQPSAPISLHLSE